MQVLWIFICHNLSPYIIWSVFFHNIEESLLFRSGSKPGLGRPKKGVEEFIFSYLAE